MSNWSDGDGHRVTILLARAPGDERTADHASGPWMNCH